jgi:hypothetical protein
MEFPPEIVAHIRGFSEPFFRYWKVIIAAKKIVREKRNLKVIQKLLVNAEAVQALETIVQDIYNLRCCGAHLFVSKMSSTVVDIEVWRPDWHPQTLNQLHIDEEQKAQTNENEKRIKAHINDPLYFKFLCIASVGSDKFVIY